MAASEETVICPHCGAENAKSPIVTMCCKCLLPLGESTPPAFTPPPLPPNTQTTSTQPAPEYSPAAVPPLPRNDGASRTLLGLAIGAMLLGLFAWRLFGFVRDLGATSNRAPASRPQASPPVPPMPSRPQPMPISAPRPVEVSTPLHDAAAKGDLQTVTRLLDSGNAVDAQDRTGETPLMLAAWNGRVEVARLLLQRGASIGARDTKYGWTPLVAAAAAPEPGKPPQPSKTNVMRLLLERGAPADDKDSHAWSVLHWAANSGLNDGVKMLLERKADPNVRNCDGKTPLHEAAYWGRLEAARLLIAAGADVNAQGRNGDTPLRYATECKHSDIVALLKAHGAKLPAEKQPPTSRPANPAAGARRPGT